MSRPFFPGRIGPGSVPAGDARRPELHLPVLCLVTDRSLAGGTARLLRTIGAAVRAGVNMVQVREKDLPPSSMAELAAEVRRTAGPEALVIINGDIEAAVRSGADGVHLAEAEASEMASARSAMPSGLIGRSVHSARGALEAGRAGADFVVFGTVFPSRSHPGGPVSGLDGISAAAACGIPVIGIGGITAGNAGSVISAGASGVAVVSAILVAEEPATAAAELRSAVWAARAAQS